MMRIFNENADDYLGVPNEQIPNYDKQKEAYSSAAVQRIESWLERDCEQITKYNNETAKDKDDQKWIIAYCHEMPFTILTQAVITKHEADRMNVNKTPSGCRINTISSNGKYYWLSRLFEKYHIPLILGGHKHTYAVTGHIKENIIVKPDGTEDYSKTYKPIIQLKLSELKAVYDPDGKNKYSIYQLKEEWYKAGKKMNGVSYETAFQDNICDFDDIEIIDDVSNQTADYSAPVYAMQTAAGYKLISNKELPGAVIPWLTVPAEGVLKCSYFPVVVTIDSNNKASTAFNTHQLYPYFTSYKFNKKEIIGTPIRMSKTVGADTVGIYYEGNSKSKGTYYLINNSYTDEEISNWTPDIANGEIKFVEDDKLEQHLIKITNKPF
jgi:hypothetical protein